jgi:hypothetical protein
MFQFPRLPSRPYAFRYAIRPLDTDGGCPIRVRLAHRSLAAPQSRFAALRALLRPLAPRHPPYTLLRLATHDTTHEPSRKKFIILVQFTRFGKIEVNLPVILVMQLFKYRLHFLRDTT